LKKMPPMPVTRFERRARLAERHRVGERGERQHDEAHHEEYEDAESGAGEGGLRDQPAQARGRGDEQRRPAVRQREMRGQAEDRRRHAARVSGFAEQACRDGLQEPARSPAIHRRPGDREQDVERGGDRSADEDGPESWRHVHAVTRR
jgi:hypothetical protein